MTTREDELAALIREQKRDDRPLQPPEKFTVPMGLAPDVYEAAKPRPRKRGGRWDSEECPIHGMGAMKRYPSEPYRPRCSECILSQQRLSWATGGYRRQRGERDRSRRR